MEIRIGSLLIECLLMSRYYNTRIEINFYKNHSVWNINNKYPIIILWYYWTLMTILWDRYEHYHIWDSRRLICPQLTELVSGPSPRLRSVLRWSSLRAAKDRCIGCALYKPRSVLFTIVHNVNGAPGVVPQVCNCPQFFYCHPAL